MCLVDCCMGTVCPRDLFALKTVAEKTAHNPSRIFQAQDRGFIREGYWADLALIDTETPTTVTKENTGSLRMQDPAH